LQNIVKNFASMLHLRLWTSKNCRGS